MLLHEGSLARDAPVAAAGFVRQPLHPLLPKPLHPFVDKAPGDANHGGNLGDVDAISDQ
jgi:hypothetical protein